MLPARRRGDERRRHRGDRTDVEVLSGAPERRRARRGAQATGEDSRVNFQHGMVAADPDGFKGRRSVVRRLPLALGLTLVVFHPLPAPLGVSFIGDAAAQCSADTDSPACSTIAPRDGAYCRASLSSARLISVSPAADAPSETRGGGVASKARADAT